MCVCERERERDEHKARAMRRKQGLDWTSKRSAILGTHVRHDVTRVKMCCMFFFVQSNLPAVNRLPNKVAIKFFFKYLVNVRK